MVDKELITIFQICGGWLEIDVIILYYKLLKEKIVIAVIRIVYWTRIDLMEKVYLRNGKLYF